MSNYNYYERELSVINTHSHYSPKIKLRNVDNDEPAETKWIDLNKESAQAIVDFLKKNFPGVK